jgi:hypothetical protein
MWVSHDESPQASVSKLILCGGLVVAYLRMPRRGRQYS